ncbi:unnamed protein product [Dovyalis caffra]|uniref:F-box domain-containing protein n=1 Tax=Dovyalis caffra TaxID=77055 RepID=A0AAV1R1W3_9ROSI|nr:unnamed protein product [Dovyalis caffra]
MYAHRYLSLNSSSTDISTNEERLGWRYSRRSLVVSTIFMDFIRADPFIDFHPSSKELSRDITRHNHSSSKTRISGIHRMTTMPGSTSACDTINQLPSNVMENILMRLPQKDAIRTSILSSKWRYKWLALPQLVFDCPRDYKLDVSERIKLAFAVYQALLLHRGPLFRFSFSVSELENCSDINHWLHFLSENDIEDFTFRVWTGEHYKLPCHLYSFQQLRHLNLYNCAFKPPSTFKGFDRLVSLEFRKVLFAAERFGIFISNCPLLERMALEGCPHFYCLRISAPNLKCLSFCRTFDSINLKNTPLLENLSISMNGIPETAKYLRDRKTSNLIEIVSSVPAVEKLSAEQHFLKANTKTEAAMEPVLEYMRVQDFSDCSLNRLREVKMQLISGVQSELEFMKLLLAKSTMLEKLEILPTKENSTNGGFQILRELIRFRRASAKAEIIYLDPDLDGFSF